MVSIVKNIIVLLGISALAGVGYYLFIVERNATIGDANFGAPVSSTVETEVFLKRLADLQSIELPTDIFNDEKFRSLQDFGSIIESVPYGRDIPFNKGKENSSI